MRQPLSTKEVEMKVTDGERMCDPEIPKHRVKHMSASQQHIVGP